MSGAGETRRWVVKIGSSLVSNSDVALNHDGIQSWARQTAQLMGGERKQAREIVIVSSGSVAEGARKLGWSHRPRSLHKIQAAAAAGQAGLMRAYEQEFSKQDLCVAQVLLTHEDISDRKRYFCIQRTLSQLLRFNVVPIVNENDTVSTKEIELGDNDTLAAVVANLVAADLLLILTDQDGLFERDPKENPDAKLIREASSADPRLDKAAQPSRSAFGRGGMITKVEAARQAARSGADTIIANGFSEQIMCRLAAGESLGTLLLANEAPQKARKNWIATLKAKGSLTLDHGACQAIRHGKSLLPVGVLAIQGGFKSGDLVVCRNQRGGEVGRGLSNYSSEETQRLVGLNSRQIKELRDGFYEEEAIHCDNLLVTNTGANGD